MIDDRIVVVGENRFRRRSWERVAVRDQEPSNETDENADDKQKNYRPTSSLNSGYRRASS